MLDKKREQGVKEPILLVMAAGMGSRYGGLKQMDPMNANGELILDFSLYDAYRAGFRRVIFVIKKQMEQDMRHLMENRAAKKMELHYVFQELSDLPSGFGVPEGRVKPWGTGHAVLAARALIDAPFAVINADDYYGASGFCSIYEFLKNGKGARNAEDDKNAEDVKNGKGGNDAENGKVGQYCMAAYQVENTLTENGSVSRGVCLIDENGFLCHITERTRLLRRGGQIGYQEEDGFHPVDEGTPVSMNLWGFTEGMIRELAEGFSTFLKTELPENVLKAEYFLPSVVDRLIGEGRAKVTALPSADRWYGVTYPEDKKQVAAALQALKDRGLYPQKLWENENKM